MAVHYMFQAMTLSNELRYPVWWYGVLDKPPDASYLS